MKTQTKSSDEAVGILEGIRDISDEINLDIAQLRSLGNLLEFANYEKIGELTDKDFGPGLNEIIERILEGQGKKLDKIQSGSRRVQEIIEGAKQPRGHDQEAQKA